MHSETSFTILSASLQLVLYGVARDEDGLVASKSKSESIVKPMSKLLAGFMSDSFKFPVLISGPDSIRRLCRSVVRCRVTGRCVQVVLVLAKLVDLNSELVTVTNREPRSHHMINTTINPCDVTCRVLLINPPVVSARLAIVEISVSYVFPSIFSKMRQQNRKGGYESRQ